MFFFRIWDKVCSGAPKILSFVAVMLVITLRRNILRSKHSDEVLKCVSQVKLLQLCLFLLKSQTHSLENWNALIIFLLYLIKLKGPHATLSLVPWEIHYNLIVIYFYIYLLQIPEQCEEVVANKAIELWQYYGAQPQNDTLAKKWCMTF